MLNLKKKCSGFAIDAKKESYQVMVFYVPGVKQDVLATYSPPKKYAKFRCLFLCALHRRCTQHASKTKVHATYIKRKVHATHTKGRKGMQPLSMFLMNAQPHFLLSAMQQFGMLLLSGGERRRVWHLLEFFYFFGSPRWQA